MPKGFASLSKQQRMKMGAKGGSVAQSRGTAYKLNALTARSASQRGVAVRRARAARAAAIVLIEAGITPEQIYALQLSELELIYFGGSRRSPARFAELLIRIGQEGGNDGVAPED
jgi:hypothetical protein